jgi:N-acetylmuramoyl-L-alanine amidase CwlA
VTVNELKAELDKLIENGKGDMEILASKDAEGNGFNNLDEVSVNHCYDDEPVHPDDIGTEYDAEDLVEKVVIWTF